MEIPSPKDLVEATGISSSYASMILSDSDDPAKRRIPPQSLAILIYRKTAWRHPSIAELSEDDMSVIERVAPWTPKQAA